MKCCGSQTTFTAPERGAAVRADRLRDVAAQFDALILKAAFAPLGAALGFYGDMVVAEATQTIAREERGGLTDRLVAVLDSAERDAAGKPR